MEEFTIKNEFKVRKNIWTKILENVTFGDVGGKRIS